MQYLRLTPEQRKIHKWRLARNHLVCELMDRDARLAREQALNMANRLMDGKAAKRSEKKAPEIKRVTRNARQSLMSEAEMRAMVAEAGLLFESKPVNANGTVVTWHWMINDDDGKRLVDFWPTNGKWRVPSTGETGHAVLLSEVLDVAQQEQRMRYCR